MNPLKWFWDILILSKLNLERKREVAGRRFFIWGTMLLVYVCLVKAGGILRIFDCFISVRIYRYIWCLGSSFIGFGMIVFETTKIPEKKEKDIFPSYFLYYPVLVTVISSLIMGLLHTNKFTMPSPSFYYLAFGLCFSLSFLVDKYWNYFDALLKRLGVIAK